MTGDSFCTSAISSQEKSGPPATSRPVRRQTSMKSPTRSTKWSFTVSTAILKASWRSRFLGRGRTCANPEALDANTRLSGTTGPVLDPIFSLRQAVQIAPEESISLAFVTAFAETRDEALLLADQYHDARVVQRTFELA